MLPDFQFFFDCCQTGWTGLACAVRVDFGKVHPTLPADPFHQRQELAKSSIDTVFSQHSPGQPLDIEIFSKNGLGLVTKLVSCLKMKVFTTVGNVMVHLGYFDLRLLPVLRTLLLSCRSALQQFQLALHRLEELRMRYAIAVSFKHSSRRVLTHPTDVPGSCRPKRSRIAPTPGQSRLPDHEPEHREPTHPTQS